MTAWQPFPDGITQSILAKAFRGELVQQDTNDELVEEMLGGNEG